MWTRQYEQYPITHEDSRGIVQHSTDENLKAAVHAGMQLRKFFHSVTAYPVAYEDINDKTQPMNTKLFQAVSYATMGMQKIFSDNRRIKIKKQGA